MPPTQRNDVGNQNEGDINVEASLQTPTPIPNSTLSSFTAGTFAVYLNFSFAEHRLFSRYKIIRLCQKPAGRAVLGAKDNPLHKPLSPVYFTSDFQGGNGMAKASR